MEFYYHDVDRDILILSADGGLNAENAEQFVSELDRLIQVGARKMVVDCRNLVYISSYGVGVLTRLHNKLSDRGGDIKLASVRHKLVELLALSKLNTVFRDLLSDRRTRQGSRSDRAHDRRSGFFFRQLCGRHPLRTRSVILDE